MRVAGVRSTGSTFTGKSDHPTTAIASSERHCTTAGVRVSSEVLPFDNQLGQVISPLLSALIHLANEAGGQEVDKLPELSIKQSNVLPPPPRPEAERLE